MASFEFLPEAEAEFIEQIAYYAGIRRELGLRFQEAVAQAITEAAVNPDHGAPRTQNTRRRLVVTAGPNSPLFAGEVADF
jgi:hypothetical protein